jgi:hypothetical protein
MPHVKGISIKLFSWAFCALFLISCHSSNDVVSSYGKRKYTKGWFIFRHGSVDTKGAKGKDSTVKQVYPAATAPENPNSVVIAPALPPENGHKKHKHHKDSTGIIAQNNVPGNTTNTDKSKAKIKKPPDPDDHIMLRLLVLVVVLTGLSILFTGLVTGIAAWGITQNYLLGVGVLLTYIAYFISVNTTLGINVPNKDGSTGTYNLGKPALKLSLWAVIPMSLLILAVKTNASLAAFEVTTIGMFFGGACILLSMILAIKALFVHDIHTGKAVIALFLDALLITAMVLLLL